MISQRSMVHAPQAALVDSIIGSRRGVWHALGALAERDECTLVLLIRARLRASWWHLPVLVATGACTLVCVPECLQGLLLPSTSRT